MKNGLDPKILLILAISMSLIGTVGVYIRWSGVQSSREEIVQLQKETRDATVKNKELEASQLKLKEASDKLAHLEQGVPQFAYVSTLLSELEATGKQCGMAVLGVRPQIPKSAKKDAKTSAKSKKAYEELNIEIKGRGSYKSVMKFLESLQSFPKIAAVQQITLTPKADPNIVGAPPLDITVELKAYLFPPLDPIENSTASKNQNDKSNG